MFRALYTKHLTKKHKTWSDGFVRWAPGKAAELLSVDGGPLASTRPVGAVPADDGELTLFEGFLVTLDGTRPGNHNAIVKYGHASDERRNVSLAL